ncbi:MAG TPA: cytochrome c oxidase accessory protein CcoG [Verrucomicrobiota bacterium]|nr:cytochrome c oxidase accessory protein CcoG [Verrucomicrobiales bacterium]HRI16019.1 cytochrome c oxidase accessory protein CcoG [Verrucomicrobiota bacterium]
MPTKPTKPEAEKTSTRAVNWGDFREHLATADKDGQRRWLYPRKPVGRWYRWRTWMSWVLIAIMFAGPFIRIGGNPLLMFNLIERKFSILGRIFWPEDTIIFAVAMLIFFAGIMIFTTAFGRLWCGWTCPQTIMMEMVFRKIEYLIEGDSHQQRALDAAPWNFSKTTKKVLKHSVFFLLSFVIGNTLLAYLIGSDALLRIITDDPRQHLVGLTFMILFTLVFYGIFARFREQACTFICPYGRFQSALLDENTMVVAYDYKRGEKRAPWKREQRLDLRQSEGLGDCVNCRQCVAVCPTGIDIRDGIQMECVNCTACLDACDAVMDKIGRPRGLIRYASLNGIEHGQPLRFTARMKLYASVLTGLIALFLILVFTRAEVETMFLRAPGAMFQTMANGRISNLYTVKVVNKSSRDLPVQFRLENAEGGITVMGAPTFVVPKDRVRQASVLVELNPTHLTGRTTKLKIGVYSGERRLETVSTSFVGPR